VIFRDKQTPEEEEFEVKEARPKQKSQQAPVPVEITKAPPIKNQEESKTSERPRHQTTRVPKQALENPTSVDLQQSAASETEGGTSYLKLIGARTSTTSTPYLGGGNQNNGTLQIKKPFASNDFS
tara:strand:- start:295 stop:669 length:375 start_codon:yes stop_codon:yes gene_type:complete